MPITAQTLNTAARQFDLSWLIEPFQADDFFRNYWEKSPLYIPSRSPRFYSDLFSTRRLERTLAFSKPKPPDIRVVAKQQELLASKYVTDEDGLNLAQLYKAYDEGHTVIINGLERFCETVACLCREVQDRLCHKVIANTYLSPAGSKGLHAHYDTHDVFVLQIEGAKVWQLYGAAVESPLLGSFQPVIPEETLGEPQQTLRLEAGDLLYMPRGHVHQAATTDASSLHMTLGIYPTQWVDLLQSALTAVSLRDARFRKALPVGYLDQTSVGEDVRDYFGQLLQAFTQEVSGREAFELLVDRFMRQSTPVPDDQFGDIDRARSLTPDTMVTKRLGMKCRLMRHGDVIRLQFPGNTVKAPASYLEAMQYVADAPGSFAVRSLPDNLDDDRKIALVKRLIRSGLIRIDRDGDPLPASRRDA
jgi:ribosomal protein L16 Arg81 hydroxylase